MTKYIFWGTFVVASLLQGLQWFTLDAVDKNMWANQARYVEAGDPKQYETRAAYGHPGTPIVIGTIAIRHLFHASYDNALASLLTLLSGIVIATICTLCFLMRRDLLWWLAILVPISGSQLYTYATPPSAIASLLIALLCVLTLYLCEKQEISWKHILFWGAISGLTISTRTDIGSIVFLFLLPHIFLKTDLKRSAGAILTASSVFLLTDFYMWYMPVQHIQDLVKKVVYHYADYAPSHIQPTMLITISFLAFLSLLIALCIFCFRKNLFPLPQNYFFTILTMTIVLYVIFLTAKYQAPRYFMPMIFIWEIFLSLFILSLVQNIHFNFSTQQKEGLLKTITAVLVVVTLTVQPIALLINDLWINSIFL